MITREAQQDMATYIGRAAAEDRLIHQLHAPGSGHFVAPALIAVSGISDLEREVFGPVLHLATFRAGDLGKVIDDVNATGYGLTFGIHTRIDDRVQLVADCIHAGNIYANRNQIGAVVGSQPFGGEGLSGTGPKAGGPHYVRRFTCEAAARVSDPVEEGIASLPVLHKAIEAAAAQARQAATSRLPGPTGELNQLSTLPRPPILCLGPGERALAEQVSAIEALGGHAVAVQGRLDPAALGQLEGFGGLLWWGDAQTARGYARALAEKPGPLLPLVTDCPDTAHALLERHLCVDTTAAGGNASLLAGE